MTYKEAAEDWGIGENVAPDYKAEDVQRALADGKIKVYSSNRIRNGTFVTPSKMEAQSYAGGGEVHEMWVDLKDVAWIDLVEGQYAKVETASVSGPNIQGFALPKGAKFSLSEYLGRWYGDPDPMNFDDADSGKVNPNYGKRGYDTNCQTCAVVYELRRRGFNVEAKPKTSKNEEIIALSQKPSSIWLNSSDLGAVSSYDLSWSVPAQGISFLSNHVSDGERYSMAFHYTGNTGHVVSVEKEEDGSLVIYDPQSDRIYKGDDINSFMSGVGVIDYLFRVDNAIIDEEKASEIVKKAFADGEIPRESS